ncbi:MAG: alpha-ketoglutarate-dependent dioxygenase AlkB family protein [Bacteroidia bacterium]
MINGVLFIESFWEEADAIFEHLLATVAWDDKMHARKTASFGVAYNYSQMTYPDAEMPMELQMIAQKIQESVGFEPNNCLINYYLDGKAKMGYHADRTDNLAENTGIAIISLGETRNLSFKNIENSELIITYPLPSGSLIYMTQELQNQWLHAIPKTNTDKGRMSLTFRNIL